MILLVILHWYSTHPFLLLQYSFTFQSYSAQSFYHSAQSFVTLSAILESRGREVARARAHGSIACGLTAQLIIHVGSSRPFDGVARCTGSVVHLIGLGEPLDLGGGHLIYHPRWSIT
jgi:hypothetical protein